MLTNFQRVDFDSVLSTSWTPIPLPEKACWTFGPSQELSFSFWIPLIYCCRSSKAALTNSDDEEGNDKPSTHVRIVSRHDSPHEQRDNAILILHNLIKARIVIEHPARESWKFAEICRSDCSRPFLAVPAADASSVN